MINDTTRKLIVEHLECARTLLPDYDYICHALEYRCGSNKQVSRSIQDFIRRQLFPASSYEGWLLDNHPELYKSMSFNQRYHARLAWIDWMIINVDEIDWRVNVEVDWSFV